MLKPFIQIKRIQRMLSLLMHITHAYRLAWMALEFQTAYIHHHFATFMFCRENQSD